MIALTKIISGGQTGADQAGLFAAEELGVATGGWMPRGFLTEIGPRPDLAERFKLRETRSSGYTQRTQTNVLVADATVIFGKLTSPGSKLTARYAVAFRRINCSFAWPGDLMLNRENFLDTLRIFEVRVLNVAGNRESTNPGIFEAVKTFLITTIQELHS